MPMKSKQHTVKNVIPGSIAEELEIAPGDKLLSIGGEEVEDIFDYQFLTQEDYLEILIEKPDGEQWLLEVDKDPEEDLGLIFESGLMDEYRSCSNKCIFCFIDQMPPGMRPTLYFKDDDSRLSFLQGNYITLTNLSEKDIGRIIRYRLEPINISFHTMNPELRCRMLHNRFAGESLKKVDRFFEAGIHMNGQIVLCKGFNDGQELEFSIRELRKYQPYLESVSVVPVGLTRFREGLEPLEPFTPEDARAVIATIERYQKLSFEETGMHFIHASDEWYLTAGLEVPEEERYDGYLQLENGVGMVRLMKNEFDETMEKFRAAGTQPAPKEISLATGMLIAPVIEEQARRIMEAWPQIRLHVYRIVNDFFGPRITVSGLLVGADLKRQLTGKDLGSALYLTENVLRAGEDVFLDDMTRGELSAALQVPIHTVKSGGCDLLKQIFE